MKSLLTSLFCITLCLCLDAQNDTVTIRIIGDVMMHSGQIERAATKAAASGRGIGDFYFSPSLDSIKADLSEATVAIANMEFSLGGRPYTGYPEFSAPDSYPQYVKDCGIDVFLTANNHILDRGKKGLLRTFREYDKLEDVIYTKKVLTFVKAKGLIFALINCTYGTNAPQNVAQSDSLRVPLIKDKELISQAMNEARSIADFTIVLPHWGDEYQLTHNAAQEAFAKEMEAAGADVIIGAHPHCVQDICHIGQVPVYYSIGNAVSNMSAVNTQLGLMVTLTFAPDENGRYVMMEPRHDWLWCSRPGYLTDGYCTIKVRDFIGRRSEWKNPFEYDKMIATYRRISSWHE